MDIIKLISIFQDLVKQHGKVKAKYIFWNQGWNITVTSVIINAVNDDGTLPVYQNTPRN